MLDFLKNIYRRRSLRRYASTVPTGIVPLRDVRTVAAFIEVEDPSFDDCKLQLQAFFREHNFKGEIFFIDFRKLIDGEQLITSITNTILKKELNWFGQPSAETISRLQGIQADICISLLRDTSFPVEFMVKCIPARFKIGRIHLPGNPFDLVVTEPAGRPLSQLESFRSIREYLGMII